MLGPYDDQHSIRRQLRSTAFVITIVAVIFLPTVALGEDRSIQTVLDDILAETNRENFAVCSKTLRELDESALAKRSVEAGTPWYLAVDGYGVIVPGIPKWRARLALSEGRVTHISGTSDYSKTDAASELQNAALEFAVKFNMHLRHFGSEVDPEKGEVGLPEVRESLSLTKAQWEIIPLHAKLRIRNMVERLLENELEGFKK